MPPQPSSSPEQPQSPLVEGLRSVSSVTSFLKGALVEREVEIHLAMVALLSRQHLLLLGPPGTGKSLLARYIGMAIGGDAKFFEFLLTRFTDPSEVFGPVSIQELVKDKYIRKTAGYLPEADCAFLDEIFKSSSAILNSLLTIINERVYDNGGRRTPVPLQSLFGASNELPQDDSLAALFDRFLLRREVAPVKSSEKLLEVKVVDKIPVLSNLPTLQQAARKVDLAASERRGLVSIREALAREGITIGDRRFMQSVDLIKATALLEGRPQTSPSDLAIVTHSFWSTPDEQPTVARIVSAKISELSSPPPRPTPPPPRPAPAPAPTPTPAPAPAHSSASSRPFSSPTKHPNQQIWSTVLGLVRRKSLEDIAADQGLHQRIHDLIASPDAHYFADDALELVTIKQALVLRGDWHGPVW